MTGQFNSLKSNVNEGLTNLYLPVEMCAKFCTPTYPMFGVEYSAEVRILRILRDSSNFSSVIVAQHSKQEVSS